MNTTQLECFLAVANFLNFSRAAEQLRITQPAVSHQISSLEDELGTKLFFRTSKSVRLTQAGHLFTQYANEILKLSGLSRARLKECQETLPQRFGIGCRNFIELRLLRPVLAQLGQQQPRLLPVLRLLPYAPWKTCWQRMTYRSCSPCRNPLLQRRSTGSLPAVLWSASVPLTILWLPTIS